MTERTIEDVLSAAAAARDHAPATGNERYDAYCVELAGFLEKNWGLVLAANARDVAKARAAGLSDELVDRLTVTGRHLDTLITLASETRSALPGLTRRVPEQEGPAQKDRTRQASKGMTVRRVPKPLGIILMIYEARPTVTIEGALLPVVVGNVTILRGGSEIAETNAALGKVAARAADAAGLPADMVQVLPGADRRAVRELIKRHDTVDALIPRGSPSLIDYCLASSTIPVIASGGGVNHLYVDSSADVDLAAAIALDSKLAEPTGCNTVEIVLAHEDVVDALTQALLRLGAHQAQPWVLRLDPRLAGRVTATNVAVLGAHDDGREFLDRSIGLRPVTGFAEATEHIRKHSSRHTEGVVATDPRVIERFLGAIDAAALVVNGSLRLHDGPMMSLGPELSISTGRLHVRGPVDLSALLTYSWVIDANGTLRGDRAEAP